MPARKPKKYQTAFGKSLKDIGFQTYTDFTKSDLWKSRREKFYGTHKRECKVCKSVEHVELHHVDYARIGKELDRDLVPLCKDHHGLAHKIVKKHKVPLKAAHEVIKMVLKS